MRKVARPQRATVSVKIPEGAGPGSEQTSRLNELKALGEQELRAEWQRLYRAQPPRLSRDLLMRGVAYRIQELANGGLSKAALRRLAAFEKELSEKGDLASASSLAPARPGTRLLREWRGRTYTVLVVEAGFEYAGSIYPSLTRIAEKITGAHWSGPRFFGLGRKPALSRASLQSPPHPDGASTNERTLPPEWAPSQDAVHG